MIIYSCFTLFFRHTLVSRPRNIKNSKIQKVLSLPEEKNIQRLKLLSVIFLKYKRAKETKKIERVEAKQSFGSRIFLHILSIFDPDPSFIHSKRKSIVNKYCFVQSMNVRVSSGIHTFSAYRLCANFGLALLENKN